MDYNLHLKCVTMKHLPILFILISVIGFSCSSVAHKIFNNQSPREKYESSIEDSPEAQFMGFRFKVGAGSATKHSITF